MRTVDQDSEFRRFVSGFAPTLLRAAFLLVGDVDLAEDAVQATMLRVFRSWDRARKAPEAYSRSTLINICRDSWRRAQRRPVEVQLAAAINVVGVESFDEEVVCRDALERAMCELAPAQREVLILRYFFDLTVQETADVLKIPAGTAKSTTSRALQRLRDVLSTEQEGEAC